MPKLEQKEHWTSRKPWVKPGAAAAEKIKNRLRWVPSRFSLRTIFLLLCLPFCFLQVDQRKTPNRECEPAEPLHRKILPSISFYFSIFFGQPMSFNVFSHRDEYKTGLNPPKLAENGQAKANCHREQWYHHVGIPKLAEKSFKHWFWVFCCIFSYVKCVLTSAKKFRKLGDR